VRDSTAAEPIAVAIDVTERSSYGPMYGPAAEILDEADLDWTGSGQEDNRGVAPLRNATKSRRLIGHRLVAAEMQLLARSAMLSDQHGVECAKLRRPGTAIRPRRAFSCMVAAERAATYLFHRI